MKRTSIMFGLAVLAEAGIASLVRGDVASLVLGVAYVLIAALGVRSTRHLPPFFIILALGFFGATAAVLRGSMAGLEPDFVAVLWRIGGAAGGAIFGHYAPLLLARYREGVRGNRSTERLPGFGRSVRIAGQAFTVRDWSVFGLFIDAPKGRFAPKQEVIVEIDANTAALAAEVVRVADTGVGLRFVGLAEPERARLRRRFLEGSVPA